MPPSVPVPRVVTVVDDDELIRATHRAWLESAGYEVQERATGAEALAELGPESSAMVLDLGLDDMNGMEVLAKLRAEGAELPVLIATSEASLDRAVQAMRTGAQDYLVKPLDRARLLERVARAIEHHDQSNAVRRAREEASGEELLRGRAPKMLELKRQLERVEESDVTVCVFGESGTGKEVVARTVHERSRRKKGPFVVINCAAIPVSLQEADLFGHERGAFTGASSMRRGRFEQAHGGTLFLDELGEMSLATQASLLRTLQERTIRRVGGQQEIPVDVRVVAATHRDLRQLVREGKFREDLYFRLVVYPVTVPPLRERPEDVSLLVGHFLAKLSADAGRDVTKLSAEALEALLRHPWPGNVRELQNVVHCALLACEGDEIGLNHLPPEIRGRVLPAMPSPGAKPSSSAPAGEDEPFETLEALENKAIARALAATGGNVPKAAKMLGVGRATLYRRVAAKAGA